MYFAYGPKETGYLSSRDAKLAEVIARVGHIERAVDPDLFSSVVHHIVGQQISTKAQATIWQRMQDALGEVSPTTVDTTSVKRLQTLGMTFRKAGYIKELARRVADGRFDLAAVEQMPDENAIRALSELPGVGVWTAEMILLFCLQRPDVLSFGDLAIQRGMRMVYRHRVLTPKLFAKYRRQLSPCGSVASLYFWAVAGGAIPELTDPASRSKVTPRKGSR